LGLWEHTPRSRARCVLLSLAPTTHNVALTEFVYTLTSGSPSLYHGSIYLGWVCIFHVCGSTPLQRVIICMLISGPIFRHATLLYFPCFTCDMQHGGFTHTHTHTPQGVKPHGILGDTWQTDLQPVLWRRFAFISYLWAEIIPSLEAYFWR
jgi:hypothetical protein